MQLELTKRQMILMVAILENARDSRFLASDQIPVVYDILLKANHALMECQEEDV